MLLTSLRITPLLALPLIVFILVALSTSDGSWTTAPMFTFDMISGVAWQISYGEFLEFASLLILFVEIVKSVNTEAREIINHGLSMLIAIVCIVLFVTNARFTNSAFFLLTTMTLIDVIAGFVITIIAARRDIGSQGSII
jgi:hypothetical protein